MMEQSAKTEGLHFKWGKKRGTGVENKDVQFYESFTYGGSVYRLYDCVSIGDARRPNSPEFFVGKIINMWEHNDQRQNPRKVELLWFFKPCELSLLLQGVQDVLANELFLASGSGVGLTNENPLEAISGKCNVLCISKDVRNPQPSDEDIKLADFLFHRSFDVGTSKILEKIDDDKVAGVDVKFIFNRTSCEKKARATYLQGAADRLKPNPPSTKGSVRQNESQVSDFSGHRKSDYGYKKEKDNECHKQLARNKSTVAAEEGCNKDSGCNASTSRRDDCHEKKDQDNEVENQLAKQKSRLAEERRSKDSYCLDDVLQKARRLNGSVALSDGRTNELQKISHDGRKDRRSIRKDAMIEKFRLAEERCSKDSYSLNGMPQKKQRVDGSFAASDERRTELQKISPTTKDAMVEKSRLAEERRGKDSYCLDDKPQKKRRLDDSVAVSDGRTKMSQQISHDSRKNVKPFKCPADKVTRGEVYSQKPSFTDKNQDLRIPRFSEGKVTKPANEKGLLKKPSSGCKISEHTEEKMLTDANYTRQYRVFEVTQKPNVEESKWFRNLTWEENFRCAEGQGNLVLLRNLDPSYSSNEVENIVYSALNEQCTARMIERTSVTIPHIGEALVIFKTTDAAKRVIRRLDEGCLLLSNGRTLVATKVDPPGMPPLQFTGHIKLRAQRRREKTNAVGTSYSSQVNTLDFELALEWGLHLDRYELTWKRLYERQLEEKRKLKMDFKPNYA